LHSLPTADCWLPTSSCFIYDSTEVAILAEPFVSASCRDTHPVTR
jgi:hypothetical protein